MIFTQSRDRINRIGRDIYIVRIQNRFHIMNMYSDNSVIDLGDYPTKEIAEAVIRDIFKSIKIKKKSFCMPNDILQVQRTMKGEDL